jgi:hypothetical protein
VLHRRDAANSVTRPVEKIMVIGELVFVSSRRDTDIPLSPRI